MEIIHQQSIDLERVADLCEIGLVRDPPQPRDMSLWHITDLLEASKQIIKGNPTYPVGRGASVPGIASLGRIWETAMDCYMHIYMSEQGGMFQSDVTLEKDGICGSLDGLLLGVVSVDSAGSTGDSMVYECKLRFSLSLDVPMSHLRQIRAYCHLAGLNTVCYVSGHVSTTPPLMQATMRWFRISQQSIEENWEGIVNTKKYLESLGITPEGEMTNAES